MTLPSGAISINQINAEFGRGTNLAAYRGTVWWTDAGATGTFSAGTIAMSEFHGKRLTNPDTRPTSGSLRTQSDWGNSQWYDVGVISLYGGDATIQARWNGGTSGTRDVRFIRAANVARVTWNDLDLTYQRVDDDGYFFWRGNLTTGSSGATVTLYL